MKKNEAKKMKDVRHLGDVGHLRLFVLAIVLFLVAGNVYSQSFTVFDIDTTDFPIMRAKFYAFDAEGEQITNLSTSDFEVKEDGQPRNVTYVSCPVATQERLSVVLLVDVTVYNDIDNAKRVLTSWIDQLGLGTNEVALVSYDGNSYVNQDFTTDRNRLINAVNNLRTLSSSEDHDGAMTRPVTGGISVAERGRFKKVVLLLSSCSHFNSSQTPSIISRANQSNVSLNFVIFDRYDWTPNLTMDMALSTGGFSVNKILYNDIESAKNALSKIYQIAQNSEPCEIEWESGITCTSVKTNVELSLLKNGAIAKTSYQSPNASLAKLDFNPSYVSFKNPTLGIKVEQKITVTARNSDFNVSNINLKNNKYNVSPTSFSIVQGESKELTVSYIATEKGYTFCKLEFETDICPAYYYLSGGYIGEPPTETTLEITKPIAGDIYVVGSDTLISWEGIAASEIVSLEYSIDNGSTWKLITNSASGLQYKWKNLPKPAATNCKVRAKQIVKGNAQGEPGTLQFTLSGHIGYVNHISWSPDGSLVATASNDYKGIIWDVSTGNKLHTLSGHIGYVNHISWSPDGSRVATASDDYKGIIWDVSTGNKLHTLSGHIGDVYHISWSPDGSRVATASGDDTAIIWDAATGTKLHTLTGHTGNVRHISWSPDGSLIATAGEDYNGIIWDVSTGNNLHTLTGHSNWLSHISWSPDGSRVATASVDSTGMIWDATTGNNLHTLTGHTHYVTYISWSPDGSRVATASIDRTGIIWDVSTGNKLHTLTGHTYSVDPISWSPDGSRVATASVDRTGIIWDVSTGNKLHTLSGHSNWLSHISWSPDGRRVATTSWDNTAKIWFINNTTSTIQEDESEVFSIVEPLSASQDIDMKKVLVNMTKDSVVTDFVQNNGSWKFRVDSIYFRGADASAFSLVSGFPEYIVQPNNAHFAEFRFIPQRVGIHNAEIVVISQAETVIQKITGEGVVQRLEVVENLIDFGKVNIGSSKDTLQTVTIKNIGSMPFTITETKHNFPNDVDFMTLAGGGNFTIQPGETHFMDLRYTPSDVGRTSGILEFHYNGVGSPAIVQLFGEGLPIYAKAKLQTLNLEAYPGDEIDVPIILNSSENMQIAGIETISADLTFNPTLLYPTGYDIERIDAQTAKIRIEDIPADAQAGEVLKSIDFIVGLGNAEGCDLILSNPTVNGGEAEIDLISGRFDLLGICYEGGARLISPSSESGITSISPNPTDGEIEIGLNLIEKGYTKLTIYNTMGEKLSSILSENIEITGEQTINLDISKYSSGLYFIVLQTPSHHFTEEVMILK